MRRPVESPAYMERSGMGTVSPLAHVKGHVSGRVLRGQHGARYRLAAPRTRRRGAGHRPPARPRGADRSGPVTDPGPGHRDAGRAGDRAASKLACAGGCGPRRRPAPSGRCRACPVPTRTICTPRWTGRWPARTPPRPPSPHGTCATALWSSTTCPPPRSRDAPASRPADQVPPRGRRHPAAPARPSLITRGSGGIRATLQAADCS